MVFLTCEVRDKLARVSIRRRIIWRTRIYRLLIYPSVAEFFRRSKAWFCLRPRRMRIRLTDQGI
jgi:hypothetical protein